MLSLQRLAELATDLEPWNPPDIRRLAANQLYGSRCKEAAVLLEKLHSDPDSVVRKVHQDFLSDRGEEEPKMVSKVAISQQEVFPNSRVLCKCNFCLKEVPLSESITKFNAALTQPNKFYCNFCLRHRYHTRQSRDILILSYRGIIGYYYHGFYLGSKVPLMYVNEIWDYIHLHARIGLENPIFNYDEESLCWFIDFSRVGKSGRKVRIEDVLTTISKTLLSFNLLENIKDIKPHKLYQRFEEAVLKFYHQRYRPEGKKILCPTLVQTGAPTFAQEKLANVMLATNCVGALTGKKIPMEETAEFSPSLLKKS